MNIDKFRFDCLHHKCNRNTFYNEKQCIKDSKIEKCFEKFKFQEEKNKKKNEEKIQKDINKWEEKKQQFENGEITKEELFDADKKLLEVYSQVNKRDMHQCVFWNHIITTDHKLYIIKHFRKEFDFYSRIIDHAHIESISENPKLKYDPDNIICLSRFFHSRFDQYRDLIFNRPITKIEREVYTNSFKKYVKEKK